MQQFFRPMPKVKLHGLLRVGSNYLGKLLSTNLRVNCLFAEEDGWKHGPCVCRAETNCVFLIKDPYAWAISFRNWEVIHERSTASTLAEFLQSPVTHPKLQHAWKPSSPIDAWNIAGRSWLSILGRQNTLLLKYEELIADYRKQLGLIVSHFKFERRQDGLFDISERADDWITPNPRKPLDITYYRKQNYVAEYTEESLSLMYEQLDHGLMQEFRYRLRQ